MSVFRRSSRVNNVKNEFRDAGFKKGVSSRKIERRPINRYRNESRTTDH